MKLNVKIAAIVAVLVSAAGQAGAQAAATGATTIAPTAPAPPPPPMIVDKKDPGSVWVRCDGQPASMSAGALAAYLLAITATGGIVGGLVGAPETGDVDKRLKGEDGVAACDLAIAREDEDIRRASLGLARAIHRIEAKQYDAAMVDLKGVDALAGVKAQEDDYRRSLGLTILELQATVLVRQGKVAEAQAVALEMAGTAPYDIITLGRALPFVELTGTMDPGKQAFLERIGKLYPTTLDRRSDLKQWTGDFVGSAADLERYDALLKVFLPESDPRVLAIARRSVAYMLAGDMTKSTLLAAEARKAVDALAGSGKADDSANLIARAEEMLDFQAIGRQLAEGKAAEARAAFAARSRWVAPTAPAVALLTERLRAGASPAELTGALTRDPAQIRADALAVRAKQIAEPADETKALYGTMRPYLRNAHQPYTSGVWRTEKSRYLAERTEKAKYAGELLFIYGAYGQAGGEALLLHAALLAEARGEGGFVLGPARTKMDSTLVMFGDPGEPGMVDGMIIDAQDVIAALSGEMPKPVKRR